MQRLIQTVLIFTLTVFLSCRKDRDQPAPVSPTNDLVRSIDWANKGTELYYYNPDSTVSRTVASSPGTVTLTRDFKYQGGRLVEILKSGILKEVFNYDNADRVASITETQTGDNAYFGTRLEFRYNEEGLVSQLDYIEFDDLKTTLKSRSQFEYKEGNLFRITSSNEKQPSFLVTYTLEDYSENCYFSPWTRIDPFHLIDQDYQIYNFPVQKQFTRLPGRIVKEIRDNGVIQEKKTEEFDYEISNRRLNKVRYRSNNFTISYTY